MCEVVLRSDWTESWVPEDLTLYELFQFSVCEKSCELRTTIHTDHIAFQDEQNNSSQDDYKVSIRWFYTWRKIWIHKIISFLYFIMYHLSFLDSRIAWYFFISNSVYVYIDYFNHFHGSSIALLTLITSKMVRLHLLYALLIYLLVTLGSMGTGEDLFYKCGAPSEENVHSPQSFLKFLFENPENWWWVLSFVIIFL